MPDKKTHTVTKNPQISVRYLADYMAASEAAKRTIVRDAKYRAIARIIQHDDAKAIVGRYLRGGVDNPSWLLDQAGRLRERIADSDFERDLADHNADYVERFSAMVGRLDMPAAELLAPGPTPSLSLGGVRVTMTEIKLRLRRATRTNKVRTGAATLRYAKGKALPIDVGEWQAAFVFGYLTRTALQREEVPEHKLCLTIDAYAGAAIAAPTDAIRRFNNMEAACASIAERWDNVRPAPNWIL